MITIYFDTCFYAWLSKTDDDMASRTLTKLNRLKVRPVLSLRLLGELTSDPHTSQRNGCLLARVKQIETPAYATVDGLSWDGLLVSPETASAFSEARRLSALGDAFGLQARQSSKRASRRMMDKLPPTLREEVREQFETPGGLAAWCQATYQQFAQMLPLLQSSGMAPPAEFEQKLRGMIQSVAEAGSIDEARSLMKDVGSMMMNLSQSILAGLGVDEQHRATSQVQDTLLKGNQTARGWTKSVLAEDSPSLLNRMLLHGNDADEPSPKAIDSLVGSLGDSEHMGVFLAHQHAIDLLQVDGPQHRQLTGRGKSHPLAQAGLTNRCFCASDLEDAVRQVETLAIRSQQE